MKEFVIRYEDKWFKRKKRVQIDYHTLFINNTDLTVDVAYKLISMMGMKNFYVERIVDSFDENCFWVVCCSPDFENVLEGSKIPVWLSPESCLPVSSSEKTQVEPL